MENLLNIYKNIFADAEKWKYYTKLNVNPFTSINNSKLFIQKFIELSGKDQDNLLYCKINDLDEKRINHIVSTFFLGTYLYNSLPHLKRSIDKIVARYQTQNKKSKIEFSFFWYLICIFHDLGYFIEENEDYQTFKNFIDGKVKYFLNEVVGVPHFYESIFENYYNYRYNSQNVDLHKPEHGICGGIILFNTLNNILRKKQLKKTTNNLYWDKSLINIYRYTCWVILAHNIFYISEGDPLEDKYNEYHLPELILHKNEEPKIKIKNHSFLFLLCLVDTIDPIKTYNSFENIEKVLFGIDEDKIVIEVNDDSFGKAYYKKINTLKEWLVPSINLVDNKLEIKI